MGKTTIESYSLISPLILCFPSLSSKLSDRQTSTQRQNPTTRTHPNSILALLQNPGLLNRVPFTQIPSHEWETDSLGPTRLDADLLEAAQLTDWAIGDADVY